MCPPMWPLSLSVSLHGQGVIQGGGGAGDNLVCVIGGGRVSLCGGEGAECVLPGGHSHCL